MVLKNDDHTGDFCQEIDANEDSSWRDQKVLVQENDGSSINRRANEAKEVFCSSSNKDDRSGSCEADLVDSLGQGVEAVDLRNNSESPRLAYDMEDKHLDTQKHSQFSEATIRSSSISPRENCHGQTEKLMQSNEVTESDEKCEPSLQTSTGDDADESDVEEEDVKVCDICGDAGREDLLAVCSRCSDGAEHTYCMREMLDKVPEGDWLCEECKFNEELEARRQEHLKLVGGNERSKSLGRTSSVNSDLPYKLDKKDLISEPSKSKNVNLSKQLSSKRSGDIIEAGPTAKKQIFESSTGSPTALSPNRVPVLSKDCSFKNLDKTKGKHANQCSAGAESGGDSSENTQSPTKNPSHNPKGNFVKSNSFGSSILKANVKVPEEVIQKQKQNVDANDGPGRLIGKSMSFKGLGRSSVSEPKVKMLSPKCAPVQELKGHKQVRERSSFERKNSIKSDHSIPPVQTPANSTKRLPRVDNISTSSVSNSRDYKNAQPDGKLTALSKQAVVNKSPDATASLGEAKRLSSTNSRSSGTSSAAEAKPNHSSKDGANLNSSRTADGSLAVANGVKVDVNDNQSEKSLENTFARSRIGINGALVSGNRRGLSSDASTPRAKEGIREENKLKAAIEAAMQKKQHIYKKNKIPEKPNEISITHESHAGDTISNQIIESIPEEAIDMRDAGLSNHISNSSKHTSISSAKQFKVYPADFVVSSEEDSVPSVSAIPEQEAVWQGGFEIHRNGKHPDVCGGFQAHLSSFASGKVLDVVKKLPPKIVLNEVSRPCAWPLQFKEAGAQDDNIALYFFAKDLDSYLRSYKILLEYMMKHDLAFRGNINGFELLVFPSNHLSHKSQRWNALFFMWGVFRGRRARFPDEKCASLERPEVSVSVYNTVPAVRDVAEAATEDLSVSGNDDVVSRRETPVSEGTSLQKSGSLSNGDCYDQGCNVGGTCLSSLTSQGNLEESLESYPSVFGAESCSELNAASLEDHCQLDPNIVVQHQHSTQEVDTINNIHESKKSLSDPMLEKRDTSSHSSEVLTVKQEGSSVLIPEQQVLCTVNNVDEKSPNSLKQEDKFVDITQQKNGSQLKLEVKVEQEEEKKDSIWKKDAVKLEWEGSLNREGCVDINVSAEDSMEDDLHSLQCSSPQRPSSGDVNETTSEAAASVIPCQKRPWVDNKDLSKDGQSYIDKRIKGADTFYGCDQRSDMYAAQMHDVSTSSRIEDTANEVVDEKTSVNPGSAERCFFLVDSRAAQTVLSEDHPSPWKVSLLGNEDRLPDGSPNLELALGVEKKQSRKGVLPFFAGIVDRKGPDRPPDIAASANEVDEDASASLSLSLAFPFSDQETPARSEKSLTTVEQTLPAKREANTSLLFFRGTASGNK
ncbi:PHD and RING finger domain-containing protein 1 [Bienertia sinuspersici]